MKRVIVLAMGLVACHSETGRGTGKGKGKGSGTDIGNSGGVVVGPGCLPSCDITSDDGVNAALVKLGEPPQPKEYACIEHVLDNRVAKLGSFAYDRGCEFERAFVGCCLGPMDDTRIIEGVGWAKASPAERAKLAPDFLADIYGVRADESAADVFGKDGHPAFTAPTSIPQADGSIVYTGWFEGGDGGGMMRETHHDYTQTQYTFGADGKISSKDLTSFSIPVN